MILRIWKYKGEHKKSLALKSITKIEVLSHRHAFDGDYLFEKLKKRLGKIKVESRESKNYRSVSYRQTGYVWFNGYLLRVFWSRKNSSARCKIEVSGPRQEYQNEFQEFLAELNEALPNLHLDSIEDTLDLYCSNYTDVRSLFKVLVRYFHVPHTRYRHLGFPKRPSPSPIQSWKLNRTCHMKDWKIYERGEDETSLRPGWHRRDTNRVRVEFTADSEILEKYGMVSLEDLIRDGHFERIFPRGFHFKVFRRSGQLPKENDKYALLEKHECFQKQLIEAREQGILNPTQYIFDAPGFDKLKKRVVRKIRKFDRDWRVNYRNILTNPISTTGRRNVHS